MSKWSIKDVSEFYRDMKLAKREVKRLTKDFEQAKGFFKKIRSYMKLRIAKRYLKQLKDLEEIAFNKKERQINHKKWA